MLSSPGRNQQRISATFVEDLDTGKKIAGANNVVFPRRKHRANERKEGQTRLKKRMRKWKQCLL
jgi:hypothetical protein